MPDVGPEKPRSTPIPAEFYALAREFREELLRDDAVAWLELGRITHLGPMIRNGTVPRPALLARTAAAWRAKVPGTGRLQLEIDLREKSLHIRELRIITGSSRLDDWGEGPEEQGICLAIVTLDISPKKFRFNNHKLAYASMHALGAGMSEATSNPESCC